MASVFLEAEWRNLILANYMVDPSLLEKYIPEHTELDVWNGKCYISLVGFLFQNTRVKGCKIPGHINFEEVNLRFYVKRFVNGECRRGVVFIKEIVPKSLISLVARKMYGEPYVTMPLRHNVIKNENLQVRYEWKKNEWNSIEVHADGIANEIQSGSDAEFITEHYWGYTKLNHRTAEYEVNHPRWKTYLVKKSLIDINFSAIYGEDFEFLSTIQPDSVFLAEGSAITVKKGKLISL